MGTLEALSKLESLKTLGSCCQALAASADNGKPPQVPLPLLHLQRCKLKIDWTLRPETFIS
ncbi:hypothetical protein CIB84_005115 [Bambusicola thoracicus]|uniref:Uncharacterized protein n=1 Tax=Bambusicola thoracicus TaxID=9083 RepID=A0A2P4T481_BAMTH|nr:hypothetical protein CIB84_005115 [Bambusicola thoracicus]